MGAPHPRVLADQAAPGTLRRSAQSGVDRRRANPYAGWRPWLIAAASVAVAASSCTLLVGQFEPTGATSGPGGASGTNTTNTTSTRMSTSTTMGPGTGGTGSTTGPGGGGMGGCMTIADCQAPPVCVIATCDQGVCGTQNSPAGFLKVDPLMMCDDINCDGNGHQTTVPDMNNPPQPGNQCLMGICDPGPATMPQPLGTSCTNAQGGTVCDANGNCVECNTSADCMGGDSCSQLNQCVSASCSNMVKDNGETDVDCGGPNCSPCDDFKNCLVGTDCIDKICTGGTCAAPQCNDGFKNGNETDVDCGGGTCPPCGPGLMCVASTDCKGGQCLGTCTANCMDGVKNNDETDVDCGGSCPTGCPVGERCNGDPDCAGNACDMNTNECVGSQCVDNRKDGSETDVDCGGGTCPGCAVGQVCKFDTDCSTMACDFTMKVCVSSQCVDHMIDGNESDVDCGGGMCPTCANGKKCKVDTDCTSGGCDTNNKTCDSSPCNDGHKDGTETDIDCGGSCSPCATGKVCHQNSDCISAACDLVQMKCVTSTCVDERKDGSETDTDCGGSCSGCPVGKVCVSDGDCMSNACDAMSHQCVSTQCSDHQQDGAETDVDCGGGNCPLCAIGLKCQSDLDCVSPNACDAMSLICVNNQCSDHRQDGTETDIDCGGSGNTCLRCTPGKLCMATSDCTAGHTCNGVTHTCQ